MFVNSVSKQLGTLEFSLVIQFVIVSSKQKTFHMSEVERNDWLRRPSRFFLKVRIFVFDYVMRG